MARFAADNESVGSTLRSGKKIPNSLPANFPDMVLDYNVGNLSEIYELKPSSWRTGWKLNLATTQINGYVNAYNSAFYPDRTAQKGTNWNPQGQVVPVDSIGKTALLNTQYQTDPGLIFYEFVKDYDPEPSFGINPIPARDESDQQYTVFAREPKTGYVLAYALIGGGVVIVIGTLAGDLLTGGLGTVVSPAAISSATMLIQRGLAAMPAQALEQFKAQASGQLVPESLIQP